MSAKLSDFYFPEPFGGYDIKRLKEFSPKEFREMYIREMETYPMITSGGRARNCEECSTEISSPRQLIRYFGLSIHPRCFEEFYSREKDELNDQRRQFWDLVLNSINSD